MREFYCFQSKEDGRFAQVDRDYDGQFDLIWMNHPSYCFSSISEAKKAKKEVPKMGRELEELKDANIVKITYNIEIMSS